MGVSWQDVAFAPLGAVGMLGAALDDKSNGSGAFASGIPSLSSIMNGLEGDPAGMAAQLQKLSNQAYGQGQQVKNFLLGRENNAEQYYRPMQQMFNTMYGTGGVMPGHAPGVPGSVPTGGR